MRQSRLPATADDRQCDRPKLSITISSAFNLPFSEWPTIFPNAACATALIDRVVHHSEITVLEGESYRRRSAEKAKKSRRDKAA